MRRHLLVGTVALTLTAIAVFFAPAAISVRDAERSVQVIELQNEAVDAAAAYGRRGDDDGERREREDDGDDDDGPGDEHLEARYRADGRLIGGQGPAQADEVVVRALAGAAATGRVGGAEVAAVPLPDGGALRVAEQAGEADAATRRAVGSLALVALLVVLGAVAAAWVLSSRLVRPLEALRRSASRIGSGAETAALAPTGIREVDEVGEALSVSSERVTALVSRERRLTGDISHQLRTPLAGLRVALEAEAEAPRDDPQAILQEALGAVDRMDASVAALLTLAREEPGGRASDLGEAAEAAGARWAEAFTRAGRTLEARAVPTPMSALRAEAAGTILDVLLENALTHGEGAVDVRVEPVEDGVRLVVADEGSCALDGDEVFTRHRSGAAGTGIGLDLARRLAEADGARLRMVSRAPTQVELVSPALGMGPVVRGTADRAG